MAAGEHQRVDTASAARRDDLATARMPAIQHQIATGERQLPAAHFDRALMDVASQHQFSRMAHIVKGAHIVGERHVAKSGGGFGRGHGLVNGNAVIAGQIAYEAQHLANGDARLVTAQIDVGDDDRTSIDEGIARDALLMFQLGNRIERIARRFAPNPVPQLIADFAERQGKRKHFGHGLDRKAGVGVSAGQHPAIGGSDGDTELRGVDCRKFRDIGRNLPTILHRRHGGRNIGNDGR